MSLAGAIYPLFGRFRHGAGGGLLAAVLLGCLALFAPAAQAQSPLACTGLASLPETGSYPDLEALVETELGNCLSDALAREAVSLLPGAGSLASRVDPALQFWLTSVLTDGNAPGTDIVSSRLLGLLSAEGSSALESRAHSSDLFLLRNLEASARIGSGEPQYALRAIDALYETRDGRSTVFTEIGIASGPDQTPFNIGLGYRWMSQDEQWLLGTNVFYDRDLEAEYDRVGFGIEAAQSTFRAFANLYEPVSDWQATRPGFEARALAGSEVGIRGQVPWARRLDLLVSARQWDGGDALADVFETRIGGGLDIGAGFRLSGDLTRPESGDAEGRLMLTFSVDPSRARFSATKGSVRGLRLKMVDRENDIRFEERRRPTVPAGYSAAWTSTPVNAGNQAAAAFEIRAGEVGAAYAYTVTSSGGPGSVTGSGRLSAAATRLTDIDVSGLADGTLTVSVVLSNGHGAGAAATADTVKGTAVPAGYAAAWSLPLIDAVSAASAAFEISAGEPGAAFAYTVTSSGGPGSVTGSGTLASPAALVSGIDVSALADGTLTVSVVLSNANGAGTPASSDTVKAAAVPAGYAAAWTSNPVNAGNQASAAFQITSGEPGAAFAYTVTSSGGPGSVTGSGTLSAATLPVTGVDVSGLADGILTVSLVLSNAAGAGPAVTADVVKGIALPSGYSAAWTSAPVTGLNQSAAAFQILGGEAGAAFAYTVTSSGGAGTVTGSGTLGAAATPVSGIDVSALPDGTLTVSVVVSNANGAGAAATASVAKGTSVPSGYSAAWTSDPVNAASQASAAFQVTSGEPGAAYAYTVTSSGGPGSVTGSGTLGAATTLVSGVDVSGLSDGTLSVSVVLSNINGAGAPATAGALKDTSAPMITSILVPANGTYDEN